MVSAWQRQKVRIRKFYCEIKTSWAVTKQRSWLQITSVANKSLFWCSKHCWPAADVERLCFTGFRRLFSAAHITEADPQSLFPLKQRSSQRSFQVLFFPPSHDWQSQRGRLCFDIICLHILSNALTSLHGRHVFIDSLCPLFWLVTLHHFLSWYVYVRPILMVSLSEDKPFCFKHFSSTNSSQEVHNRSQKNAQH